MYPLIRQLQNRVLNLAKDKLVYWVYKKVDIIYYR